MSLPTVRNISFEPVFLRNLYIDRRHHLSSILEIGCQCDYGSNMLHIDRHADAARPRETNVHKFQTHNGKENILNLLILFDILNEFISFLVIFIIYIITPIFNHSLI